MSFLILVNAVDGEEWIVKGKKRFSGGNALITRDSFNGLIPNNEYLLKHILVAMPS